MEQQVPTVNLPSPIPSHYSVVSDSSPLVVQDPSALNVSPNQQQVMSPNSTTTATLMQATRLDIPVQVLEQFAQASVLDASTLEDLRGCGTPRSHAISDKCSWSRSDFSEYGIQSAARTR